jgi:hypothetical protein
MESVFPINRNRLFNTGVLHLVYIFLVVFSESPSSIYFTKLFVFLGVFSESPSSIYFTKLFVFLTVFSDFQLFHEMIIFHKCSMTFSSLLTTFLFVFLCSSVRFRSGIHYLLFVFLSSSIRYRSGVGFVSLTNFAVIMDTVKKQ